MARNDAAEAETRSLDIKIDRRQFMVGAAGLTLGFGRSAAAQPAGAREAVLSPWVTISTDDTVAIMSPAAEMGQGSSTSLPLILAEELDADWARVRIVRAPPNDAVYGNPNYYGVAMYTSGSATVSGYYKSLRIFGAQIRRVLLDNAARNWGVPVEELTTSEGIVRHEKSNRHISYGAIAAFATIPDKAPEIKETDLKRPDQFRLIGRNVLRADIPSKTNGSAKYSIDIQVPGLLYAAVLRSPVEGSAPSQVNDGQSRAVAGVVDVVRLPYGVGVVARTPSAAFRARDLLSVTWTRDGKAWGFASEPAVERYKAAARDLATRGFEWDKTGDAIGALQNSKTVYEAEYQCDWAYHAQMEPLNAVAAVAPDGNSAEIWCGTQSQTMAVGATAQALGIPADRIKLNDMLLGGGFGRRGHRDQEFLVDAVLLSKTVGNPVKVIWTREDDIRNGRFRPSTAHYLRAGLNDGQIEAWHYRFATHVVTPFQDPQRFKATGGRDFNTLVGAESRSYAVPNRLSEQLAQDDGIRASSLRGIGVGAHKFAIEAFLDEIAASIKIDPVALRLRLLKDNPRGRRVVETVTRMAEWSRPRQGTALGFAFVDYSNCMLAGIAEVSVDRRSGKVRCPNFWLAMDAGLVVQPDNAMAQTESCIVYGLGLALTERITFEGGAVQQSNFYDYEVPRMTDIPELHIELVPSEGPPLGVGQMATPVVAPAVHNAIAALTGVRLRRLPMSPERVVQALKG